MRPVRATSHPVLLRFTFWAKVRIFFGARVLVIVENRYGIHEPKVIDSGRKATLAGKKDAAGIVRAGYAFAEDELGDTVVQAFKGAVHRTLVRLFKVKAGKAAVEELKP